ncbi:MAG TPA: serine/threonine-protein kinase [Tepidisphaeraceae bacterium]|jgi:serine/threonine-protein kinase
MSLFGSSSTSHASSQTPTSLGGYEIIRMIGEGAGSLIYAASDPNTRQVYALKHVVREKDKDVRFVEQLETEHEVGKVVRHPGLRRTFDLKINKNLLFKITEAFLVMELFDGRPLEFNVPKTVTGIVDVFIKTAEALDALHLLGYVHCDLKPNNILIGDGGVVKVIDLGQAAKTGTAKSRIQGTPDYIAPEQVKCQPVTFRTDVYNLGTTMYWTLTGGQKLPTLYTLKKSENSMLVDDLLPSPAKVNPKVPEPLSNLVMECVRVNPIKRPKGMADIARRLEIIRHVVAKEEGLAPSPVTSE